MHRLSGCRWIELERQGGALSWACVCRNREGLQLGFAQCGNRSGAGERRDVWVCKPSASQRNAGIGEMDGSRRGTDQEMRRASLTIRASLLSSGTPVVPQTKVHVLTHDGEQRHGLHATYRGSPESLQSDAWSIPTGFKNDARIHDWLPCQAIRGRVSAMQACSQAYCRQACHTYMERSAEDKAKGLRR